MQWEQYEDLQRLEYYKISVSYNSKVKTFLETINAHDSELPRISEGTSKVSDIA